MTRPPLYETYCHNDAQEADLTLNTILNLIAEGTWDWNGDTGEVIRSPGWFQMLGYEPGRFGADVFTWEKIIHPSDYPRVMQHIERFIRGQSETYCIDYRCRKANGEYLWITDRAIVATRDAEGKVTRIVGAHQDIHERKLAQQELLEQNQLLKAGNLTLEKRLSAKTKELEKRNAELQGRMQDIERMSQTDPLTRIANRKKFEEELIREKARADRYQHPLSLVIFDIDYFKTVNDTYGHQTGDQVLQELAALVMDNIRDIDFFARWGGEEFVLILPGTGLIEAHDCIEKLRQIISRHEILPDLRITCSFGVTQYQEGDKVDQMFSWIDDALYLAKHNGRNRVEVFTSPRTPDPK